MKKKDFCFVLWVFLLGIAVWFFPKNTHSIKFLGFSKPLLLYTL